MQRPEPVPGRRAQHGRRDPTGEIDDAVEVRLTDALDLAWAPAYLYPGQVWEQYNYVYNSGTAAGLSYTRFYLW